MQRHPRDARPGPRSAVTTAASLRALAALATVLAVTSACSATGSTAGPEEPGVQDITSASPSPSARATSASPTPQPRPKPEPTPKATPTPEARLKADPTPTPTPTAKPPTSKPGSTRPTATARPKATSTPSSSSAWRACTTTLGGVSVSVLKGQRSVTVVNGSGGSYATVSFHLRTATACGFVQKFSSSGRLGYGGLTDGPTRKQGTGTTPTGTYTMTEAFGLKANPGSWLPYRRVAKGDFWVEDNDSAYYNNYRNERQGGFRPKLPSSDANSSERLTDYPGQYDYSIVINFNRRPYSDQKAYRGAGIFLHVNGSGATAGCVSLPRDKIITVLTYLRTGDRITIVR